MATYSITTAVNIDSLTSKAGNDTYNINGWALTIDQDSRVGTEQNTSATLGNITISPSLWWSLLIDGRDIWMIPFSSGSGTVPAWNTTISNSTGSGKLIGVHADLTSASVATGWSMPATGFIRVKQKSGAYTSGALTGITADADDAGRVGRIEVVGTESGTLTGAKLWVVEMLGEWFELGTTSWSSNQTMQIPNNWLLRFVWWVFIETGVWSGVFEPRINAGTITDVGTDEYRGKVVWINDAWLVRIGNNGSTTMGYTPVSWLNVVIGNIILENATSATKTANAIPHATVGTRYDTTMTNGMNLDMDKVTCAWYINATSWYDLNLSNSSYIDYILLQTLKNSFVIDNIGVWSKPSVVLGSLVLAIYYCTNWWTITNSVLRRATAPWSENSIYLWSSTNITMTDCTVGFIQNATSNSASSIRVFYCQDIYIENIMSVVWTIYITGASDCTFKDIKMCAFSSGTTTTTYFTNWFVIDGASTDTLIDWVTFPVTNTHPYTRFLYFTDSFSITAQNIWTYASPLDMGTVNPCQTFLQFASVPVDCYIKRVYVKNTVTHSTLTAQQKWLYMTNVFGDYADTITMYWNNTLSKWIWWALSTVQLGWVYGTHFADTHDSTTTGRIYFICTEPTAETAGQVTFTGNAKMTGTGYLSMPTSGDTTIFTMPYYCIGHTGFSSSAAILQQSGSTITTQIEYSYQLDINDGNGFWSWSSQYSLSWLATQLNTVTISAVDGFKLKLKLTCVSDNTGIMQFVYIKTTSTTTTQAYQYPLSTYNVTLTGLVSGTEVRAYVGSYADPWSAYEIWWTDSSGTEFTFEQSNWWDTGYIHIIKQWYVFLKIPIVYSTTGDESIPIFQSVDRVFSNP